VASYDDGAGPRTINSNTVTVRVDELLDVTLTSLDPGPVAARPGEVVLSFELTNQGNGPEAFRLIANPAVAGNDFDVTVTAVAIDSNGNGVYDAGVDELMAEPQTTAELAPDAVLTLFVLATVPEDVSDTQTSNVELAAEAVTGNGAPGTVFAAAGVDGGDAIVGTTEARAIARGSLVVGITSVALAKAVTLRDPFGGESAVPGSIASFTITATVSGSGSVADLVVTDAIPEGTTYTDGTLALDGAPLTDAADADSGTASNADGISVDLGSVTGGTVHTITFDVAID
ncbi:MAG: conserved repeat domain, partial [Porphyrobacter sp. HL-46]